MGFIGIYKAVYDYTPQAAGELQISEGDVLYVLEKSTDDDWWKAKKKATADEEEEPEGLIPNNYIEEIKPEQKARALYEYTRQTDEELSFPEDVQLDVYDDTDPDWILVGLDGEYGFVPANYIEVQKGAPKQQDAAPAIPTPPPLPVRTPSDAPSPALPPRPPSEPSSPDPTPAAPSAPSAPNPATMMAGMMAARSGSSSHPPAPLDLPPRQKQYVAEEEEEDVKSPPLPARPRGDSHASPVESSYRSSPSPGPRRYNDYSSNSVPQTPNTAPLTPGDYHLYNINEMVSVMGKKKKMPTTLGINLRTGIILVAPEHASDGPSQEWTADRMTHYSREGKHVFMELVKPSKSIDFHAGAKDTAEEIVAMLGELAGAVRAEGLMEIVKAGAKGGPIQQKKGVVLYDFLAQGEDEVTVGIGDEVIVLDDTKSEEWWQVRRVKNQQEGVVPSSYIEVTGILDTPVSTATAGVNAGRSTIEQNRLEEARLTKEAIKAAQREDKRERDKVRVSEVGPGLRLPERSSSLSASHGNTEGQQHGSRRENGHTEASGSSKPKDTTTKSKPDPSKVRTWTDRSKSFTVEAQFLGVKDGKLNLHKMNGVRIAVPISKMSVQDLEYVERVTGISLDEDKPLSDLKKRATSSEGSRNPRSSVKVGATVEPKKSSYDWFNFFLSCDVQPGLCERYSQAFDRDSMDESVLPDVDATVLRNLGLREGDIIKVMRYLDLKYGRSKKGAAGDDDSGGGLFSGPGGTLRNNTRKGRPAPPVETNNVVDPNAFKKDGSSGADAAPSSPTKATTASSKSAGGFEDDAWDVKPSKTPEPALQAAAKAPEPASAPAPAPAPAPSIAPLTGSMQELSLLTQPLTPEKVQPPAPAPILNLAPAAPAPAPAQVPQPTGATPGFFQGIQPPAVNGQQYQLPQAIARQRPLAPQYAQGQGALMPPPPSRPLSAPQSAQPSQFAPPPLQPQMTGYQTQVALPGQSLNEINQARLQMQYAQAMQTQQQQMQPMQPMMPMMTGIQPQPTGFQVPGQFIPQPTGMTAVAPNPLQMQPTGFAGGFGQPPQVFTPGLVAQPTGMLQPQQTGMVGGFGVTPAPPPGATGGLQAPMQPLVPQQTGPPPPVRFGVSSDAKKLAPQPTGRKANLAAATPDNPFGF
ncbi:actin cytoskeleton-regulatory complex protein sla1 [Cladorrhinum sp. PSN332]|nr:actin cytoskeleton-regulatory complex protein sla1 [Cladorrhinum sp. PSN332]